MGYFTEFRRLAWLATALAAGVTTAASAQTYREAVAATNPLASFQLDSANAPSTNGLYTTNWQNVTVGPGAPLASIPGNTGAFFDGTGAVSQITTNLNGLTPGRGSIVAWINAAMLPSTAGRIFYIAGQSQFSNDFDFQYDAENFLSFCVGAGECLRRDAGNSLVGGWHMVTASYDATRGAGLDTQSIYIDGTLFTGRSGNFSDSGHSSPFTIGYSSVFGGREFAGLIDEVSVYDRELTASEIATLYAARLNGGVVAGVPEPTTWALMLAGFGAIGGVMRRRDRRAPAALA